MGHFIHPFILLCPDCLYASILSAEKRNQEKGWGIRGGRVMGMWGGPYCGIPNFT